MSYTRVKKDENVNDKDATDAKVPLALRRYKPFYSIDDDPNGKVEEDDSEAKTNYPKRIWLVLTKPYWNLFILISLIVKIYYYLLFYIKLFSFILLFYYLFIFLY